MGFFDLFKKKKVEEPKVDAAPVTAEEQEAIAIEEQKQAEAEAEHKRLMEENSKASAEWLAEVEKMEGVQKTESGILYRIDREGTGVKATNDTDIVNVNYEGKTRNGNIFDSSYERGEAIEFPLNRVIKGWTEGMKLVAEGGQITLWIPAEMAYGERGAGEDIGPNEALEFKVELISVKQAE
jgi:FKBP-type peptidyl-prolyl cis-trans isomerase